MTIEKSLIEFCQLKLDKLNESEKQLIDSVLFIKMYEALMFNYINEHNRYLRLIKTQKQVEHMMIDAKIVQFVIKDILHSGEYTLPGLAYYTGSPQDIIHELATGQNCSPGLSLSRKLFELHRMVKPELYKALMKQVMESNE